MYFCFTDYPKAFDCVDHNKWRKILKEIRIPDPNTCLLRNPHAGEKQQLDLHVEQWTGSKSVKEHGKTILSPRFSNLHSEDIMRMPSCMNHNIKSRLLGEILTTSDVQMIPL